MEIANSTVRLEDADSITGLAIAVRALHAEHPSSSGLARGIGGTVWIGEQRHQSRAASQRPVRRDLLHG